MKKKYIELKEYIRRIFDVVREIKKIFFEEGIIDLRCK